MTLYITYDSNDPNDSPRITAIVNDFRDASLGKGAPLTGKVQVITPHDRLILPFTADDFEKIVLEAQKDNRIADFRRANWPTLRNHL